MDFYDCGAYVEINAAHMEYNAKTIISAVSVPVIAVLKCDGYGTGLLHAAKIWKSAGAKMFAVSDGRDALRLRDAGFDDDILLLSPVVNAPLAEKLIQNGVILSIDSRKTADFYSSFQKHPIRVHIAVDTGLGRFGFKYTDKSSIPEIYRDYPFNVEGIYSHFSASFEKKYSVTKTQLDRFQSLTRGLEQCGITVGMRHIANSAAALRFLDTQLDAVRVGSALVGRLCCKTSVNLRRIGIGKAPVIALKSVQAGDSVGYGGAYRVRKSCTAAIVAVGYGSGFGTARSFDYPAFIDALRGIKNVISRHFNPPSVRINGGTAYPIGRIAACNTLFDVDGLNVNIGDIAEFECDIMHNKLPRKYI